MKIIRKRGHPTRKWLEAWERETDRKGMEKEKMEKKVKKLLKVKKIYIHNAELVVNLYDSNYYI